MRSEMRQGLSAQADNAAVPIVLQSRQLYTLMVTCL